MGDISKIVKGMSYDFTVEERNSEVWIFKNFECGADEEAGDAAWDLYCDIYFDLKRAGLKVDEHWADNDTIGIRVSFIDPAA